MKPRLEATRLTPEDTWIFVGLAARRGLWRISRESDRRDADLMLGFIRLPQLEPSLRGFRPLARMAFYVQFEASPL